MDTDTKQITIVCITAFLCFGTFVFGCTEKLKSDNEAAKVIYYSCTSAGKQVVLTNGNNYQCI